MNIAGKINTVCSRIHNYVLLKYKIREIPPSLTIRGAISIFGAKHPNILLGQNVVINSSVRANPSGGGQCKTLLNVHEGATLRIGDNSGISNSSIICANSIIIGANVNIGVNCIIYDTDMHSVDYRNRINNKMIKTAPVIIDDGVWICGHCIILKGVHIGKRSVIAAGSVVTHDVPEDELWGGGTVRIYQKIRDKLVTVIFMCKTKYKHIHISPTAIVTGRKTYFEGDNYIGERSVIRNSYLGKMSYVSNNCYIFGAEIGRFASIGPNFKIIYGNHPTSLFVSSHPAFYVKQRPAGRCYVNENKFSEMKYWDEQKGILAKIGNDVWIATDVKLLSGLSIGDGAVICAGAVVTKNVPPYAVVGGIPAEIIKYRFPKETIEFLNSFKWWDQEDEWFVKHADEFENIDMFMANQD